MQHVTREQVRPLPVAVSAAIEPYRVLFPLGAALAIAGVAPWLALAAGITLWPGRLHAGLMMEGFELSFVSGFLLTAMPAFTHGAKAHASETWGIAAGIALSALAAFAGLETYAHAFAALVLIQLLIAVAGRAFSRLLAPGGWGPGGAGAPPEEFLLVGLGLLAGVAGTAWQAAVAAGWAHEPALHMAEHLVSRFMVLALVLGLGGLLVPTFAMMPEPLTILGVARAGDRPRRRAFTAALAVLLVGALVAEATQHPRMAAVLRAAAGAASTLLAWKLLRPEGRRDGVAWAIRAAGWGLLAGLASIALWPAHEIALWHVVFVAGYGLLTLGIGTRVVVSHGGHGLADEARVLSRLTLSALALALVLRVGAEYAGAFMLPALAGAAVCWIAAWGVWLARAWPRVRQTRKALLMPRSSPSPR